MAAAAIQGSRERSHAGDDAPGSSYSDHQKDDEEDVARRVKAFVASIQALQDKLNLPPQWFHASATVDWWQQHGEGLREQAAKLEKRLQSDRDNFGEKGVLAEQLKDARKAFRPGSGNRKGHHPPMVYSAYEMALGLVKTHWRTRDAGTEVKGLFNGVGINLTIKAIERARQKRRLAPPNPRRGNFLGEIG